MQRLPRLKGSKNMKSKNDKLQVVMMDVNALIPYDKNPRDNKRTVDKLKQSIGAFGFKNPIILDENNVIVSGHARLKAAQLMGLKEVPCVRASGLTEDEIRAFRIADNKTAELAGWDYDKLCAEMTMLMEGGAELELTGFNEAEQFFYTNHEDEISDDEKEKLNEYADYADNHILKSFNVCIICETPEEKEMLKSLLMEHRAELKRLYRAAELMQMARV